MINITPLSSKTPPNLIEIGEKKTEKNFASRAANKSGKITKKSAEMSFSGLLAKEQKTQVNFEGTEDKKKLSKVAEFLYNSDRAKWVLSKACDHNLIFSAGFALLLTCILRPASIMVLPSKKNKDDQRYASAQSIASGVIGFAISTMIFTPFQNAAKSLRTKLEDPNKLKSIIKNESCYLEHGGKITIINSILERLPDIVFAAPKGILTVALIPPILKYVFGMEKKKDASKKIESQPAIYYGTMNFKHINQKERVVFKNLMEGGSNANK